MLNFIPWILTVCLYISTFRTLYLSRWETLDYTHAYFILPVSLFILLLKRKELQVAMKSMVSSRFSIVSGLLLLTFGLLLFVFGWRLDYLIIQTFSLFPVLIGLILFQYNTDLLKRVSFPLFYLLLLVPIPVGVLDNITLPMRYAASVMSAALLKLAGFEIVREGLLINMGGHEIFMGAPCSGFRSLITMLSLGLIYIYFIKGSKLKNGVLFLSIFPLALFGNLLRVIILCLITFYFGEEVGQGFFHYFSGGVVFFVMILGLMGLEKIINTNLHESNTNEHEKKYE